jgi:hypothetical protein
MNRSANFLREIYKLGSVFLRPQNYFRVVEDFMILLIVISNLSIKEKVKEMKIKR